MRRFHYAWVILLLAFLAIATGTGVRLAFGSFVHPWEHDFGVSRGTISLVATFSFVIYGLCQPVVGRWADRGGPGAVLSASMLTVAFGLVLSYFAQNVWTLGLAFGLVASAGFAGVSQVPATVAVTRWFNDRRGMAMAIISMGSSVGQMVVPPATIFLNDSLGWRSTTLILAGLLALLSPLVWCLLKPSPGAVGLLPYGGESAARSAAAEAHGAAPEAASTWRDLLAKPTFWYLAIPYFVCGVTTTGLVDTHLVPFAHDQHLPQGATATAVALLAGFNSLGVMLAGYLSDKVSRRYLLAVLYALRGVALLFLLTVQSGPALLVFSVFFGLVDFATVPPTISLSAEIMGGRNVGLVYGLVSLTHQVGSAVGAFFPGAVHDAVGTYRPAILLAAASLVIATVLSLKVVERQRPHQNVAAG